MIMTWAKYTLTGSIRSNGMFHEKKEGYSLFNQQNECTITGNNHNTNTVYCKRKSFVLLANCDGKSRIPFV